ncbi:hypothetical protein [Carboxylicivirga linearis]|uniref:GNAT family N-acetyltransferase n=1 Tax=Carboxylicivirga linearis TaxID=1628157 RepID=A0ABS5JUT3_9BACT|nr:hypothetical protein [Carboxylicivirga linearis]MBS2098229.1 hypothetical protein [Carboxylicivirga linearis]
MIEVINYSPEYKDEWDKFVKSADNFSFLFLRDYIEYHSDRFEDYSLLLIENRNIKALLPGNIYNDDFISHQGLTYGGIILPKNTSFEKHLLYLNSFIDYLKHKNIKHFILKSQNYFYSQTQQNAYEYIFASNTLIDKQYDLGTHIKCTSHEFPKKCVRKGKLALYETHSASDASLFWPLLEKSLDSIYDSKPVHTLEEIEKLKSNFPENIQFIHLINIETGELDAGAVLFAINEVVKVQYLAVNENGRKNRASDVLYYNLIAHLKEKYQYIDFGTNMKYDNSINSSLLSTKEKFGTSIHPVIKYKIDITSTLKF